MVAANLTDAAIFDLASDSLVKSSVWRLARRRRREAGEQALHHRGGARPALAGARAASGAVELVDDGLDERLVDMRWVADSNLVRLAGADETDRHRLRGREEQAAARADDLIH